MINFFFFFFSSFYLFSFNFRFLYNYYYCMTCVLAAGCRLHQKTQEYETSERDTQSAEHTRMFERVMHTPNDQNVAPYMWIFARIACTYYSRLYTCRWRVYTERKKASNSLFGKIFRALSTTLWWWLRMTRTPHYSFNIQYPFSLGVDCRVWWIHFSLARRSGRFDHIVHVPQMCAWALL